MLEGMGAGHFIFIPTVLLIGIVIGWLLGGRAARDAYASELKKVERRNQRAAARQSPASAPTHTGDE